MVGIFTPGLLEIIINQVFICFIHSRPLMNKLYSVGQLWLKACYPPACVLRKFFTLKGLKKNKKQKINMWQTLCDYR